MNIEEREVLDRIASKVDAINTFVFGHDGQGGMNRALEAHRMDDLEKFQQINATVSAVQSQLSTVNNNLLQFKAGWKVAFGMVTGIMTFLGVILHMAIDWLKGK